MSPRKRSPLRASGRAGAAIALGAACSGCVPNFDALTAGTATAGSSGAPNLGGAGMASSDDVGSAAGTGGSGGSGDQNLFANGDFEGGPSNWLPVGNCTVALSSVSPRSGAECLLTSNRHETWEGPGYSLLGVLAPGQAYRVSIWARSETGSSTLTITYKQRCVDDPTGSYAQLGSRVVSGDWAELSGFLTAPTCDDLVESVVYVEASSGDVSYSIDDTSLLALSL